MPTGAPKDGIPDPRLPTACPPGSLGKIAVLEVRAAHRLPLFVRGDAAVDEEGERLGQPDNSSDMGRRQPEGAGRGVRWNGRRRKWEARARGAGRRFLGYFATRQEAIEARERAGPP